MRASAMHASFRVAAPVLALAIAQVARAHGEAAWIMDGKYAWCCGEKDCAIVPATRIRIVPGGYLLLDTGEIFPEDVAKPSPDDDFWRCRTDAADPKSPTRCFFKPLRGW
jgi:hypothetical protein